MLCTLFERFMNKLSTDFPTPQITVALPDNGRGDLSNDPSHHFAGAGKQINLGKRATQTIEDYHPSHFAGYLIAQMELPR